MDRLQIFLDATNDDTAIHVTLRGLVFHMLEAVAPKLYAARSIQPIHEATLQACANVSYAFDESDADVLQAGIDAWYLRHVRGLPHHKPDEARLRAMLQRLKDSGDAIYSWLLGELAARAGLDVRLTFTNGQFSEPPLHGAYFLTHLVMLDTDYFTRPASHAEVRDWSDALARLIPWLTREPNPDLAGEVALCLHFLKHPEATAAKKLIEGIEPGPDTHEQATMLLALCAE